MCVPDHEAVLLLLLNEWASLRSAQLGSLELPRRVLPKSLVELWPKTKPSQANIFDVCSLFVVHISYSYFFHISHFYYNPKKVAEIVGMLVTGLMALFMTFFVRVNWASTTVLARRENAQLLSFSGFSLNIHMRAYTTFRYCKLGWGCERKQWPEDLIFIYKALESGILKL